MLQIVSNYANKYNYICVIKRNFVLEIIRIHVHTHINIYNF